MKKVYPFASKASILAVVLSDDAFAVECLQILFSLQTSHEQETKSTVVRNKVGFMSSHSVVGSKLAIKSLAEGLTGEEVTQARAIALRYGRQLAAHFRREAISNDPSLEEVARLFSAV